MCYSSIYRKRSVEEKRSMKHLNWLNKLLEEKNIIMNNKNLKIYTVILAASVFLSACRLHKEYQRPELELPQQFSTVGFADTSSIADVNWKEFFSDTTLQGLIERGLNYNHDLLIALKRIEIAGQQLKQAKALQLPEADLRISGNISRPSDNSLNGISLKSFLGKSYVENYNASLNISWEADIWGKIRAQKEVALTEYLRTYEGAKAVQTFLVASIAQGFYNLLMLDKQLEIARKNLL